jgi:type IV secretion system protein VirB11
MNGAPSDTVSEDRRRAMLRTAMGPAIAAALADPTVLEVMINPDGALRLDRLGEGRTDTGTRFDPAQVERIIRLVASHARVEVHAAAPIISAELPPHGQGAGERFEGVLPPVSLAPCFSIRKPATRLYTLMDYVADGIMSADIARLLSLAVVDRRNILVAGGTSSGKTTLANALLAEMAHLDERVILIEDTRELQSPAPDTVALRTRTGSVTMADLKAWQLRTLRRRGTIQRVVSDLKAALNRAWTEHRRALPGDLPVVIKHGLAVEAEGLARAHARDNQVLADDDIRRIVTAACALDEDFGRLVVLLAATGARFAQVSRLRVADVQAGQGRVMVPESFKGKKKASAYIRVQVGADVLAALGPALDGRVASAPLLERWRHVQVRTEQRRSAAQVWERSERGPWTSSSEMTRMWQRACEDAGVPRAIIPYALRHSSIVRGLRFGLPIRLVAALHDTSVAMIERHYSRWITEGLDELAARAVVPIVAVVT